MRTCYAEQQREDTIDGELSEGAWLHDGGGGLTSSSLVTSFVSVLEISFKEAEWVDGCCWTS